MSSGYPHQSNYGESAERRGNLSRGKKFGIEDNLDDSCENEDGEFFSSSRGRGISRNNKLEDSRDGDRSNNGRRGYLPPSADGGNFNKKNQSGLETGIQDMNITNSDSSRFNRSDSYSRYQGSGDNDRNYNTRKRFGNSDEENYTRGGSRSTKNEGSDYDEESKESSYSRTDEGEQFGRHRDRGRGGRGGGRGFHNRGDSINEDSNGGFDNDEESNNSRYSRGDEGDNSGRGRGRGGRGGGSGRGFSSENNDEDDKPRERYIPPTPTDDEETIFSSAISSGINFSKYDNISVKISGENVPKTITSFEDCNFSDLLLENIKKSGYLKPTPIQKHALPVIIGRRDVMGCAQTGSGKTAAFLLPIIHTLLKDKADLVTGEWIEPQVIICSPTRELSQQIFHEARKFAYGSMIKVAIVYGGTATFHQASIIARGCHILVATPGRLNDFVSREKVKFSSCRFFVLDEADRMLDMGFLSSIEKMLDHETMTPKGQRQTLMFSATFPDEIQRLAGNYLHEYLFLAVGIVGGACADVEQTFHLVPKFEKKDKLLEILSSKEVSDLTLVFVEQQRTADFIAAFLSENKFPTTSIHGARLQSQREQALADFKSGRMSTLVATAVAARGLDIKNIAHVINFDMPSTIEEYVHRIGRTGRVGNRGKASSFYDPNADSQLVQGLLRILEQSGQVIPSFFDGVNDPPSYQSAGGNRKYQNFGGQDVRGDENVYNTGPAVVKEEVEEDW